jgi:hypothetical protein
VVKLKWWDKYINHTRPFHSCNISDSTLISCQYAKVQTDDTTNIRSGQGLNTLCEKVNRRQIRDESSNESLLSSIERRSYMGCVCPAHESEIVDVPYLRASSIRSN